MFVLLFWGCVRIYASLHSRQVFLLFAFGKSLHPEINTTRVTVYLICLRSLTLPSFSRIHWAIRLLILHPPPSRPHPDSRETSVIATAAPWPTEMNSAGWSFRRRDNERRNNRTWVDVCFCQWPCQPSQCRTNAALSNIDRVFWSFPRNFLDLGQTLRWLCTLVGRLGFIFAWGGGGHWLRNWTAWRLSFNPPVCLLQTVFG